MESCPVEICQQIFALACTDGGHTGRSLSLVSRYVHVAAEDVRYHALSIIGSAQIYGFVAFLDKHPAVARQVQHMFLSDYTKHDDHLTEDELTVLHLVDGRPGTSFLQRAKLTSPISRLLISVAQQLRTLTLFHPTWVNLERLPSCFPLLQEMTLYSHNPWHESDTASGVLLPVLRRLHLIACDDLASLTDFAPIAPSLTHLRFSEVGHETHLPSYVTALLGNGDGHPSPWDALSDIYLTGPLSPDVRHVTVHLSGDAESIGPRLAAIAARDPSSRLRVLLNGDSSPSRRLDTAFQHWQSRLEGGHGCWE